MSSVTTSPAGRLITVTGIDGAGKTTLAAALHGALTGSGHPVIQVGKYTTQVAGSTDLSEYTGNLNAVIYRRKANVSVACGDRYWLFALAAWYSLQDRLIIQPALRAGTHVILDNSHYKILARCARSREVPAGLASQVFAHLPRADATLFLAIPAEEALRRKQVFSSLETGHTGTTAGAFTDYQDSVAAELRKLAASQAWAVIDVAGKPADTVLKEALAVLTPLIGLERTAHPLRADASGSRT